MHTIVVIALRATASFFISTCALAQSDNPSKYTIKQSDPSTGSIIPRNIVTSGEIPLNKKYSELNAEQKAYLRSQYEGMDEADEPPFPEEGWESIYKLINKGHQRVLAAGKLTMYVEVDSKGNANAIKVLRSPDPEITKIVAGILMLSKYKPAICSGKPCKMEIPFFLDLTVRL